MKAATSSWSHVDVDAVVADESVGVLTGRKMLLFVFPAAVNQTTND